jgi:hypothetical protein
MWTKNWVAWRDGYMGATRTALRPGRPCNTDAETCIVLALSWLSSTADQRHLELIFGSTHTQVSTDLSDGLAHLGAALKRCPAAAVVWPTLQEQLMFHELITSAYGQPPLPVRVFGFTDGKRDLIFNPDCPAEQNLFYNGWTKTTGVLSLFTYTPDGRIVHANCNLPNKLNDKTAAVPLVGVLRNQEYNPLSMGVLVDPGFSCKDTDDILVSENFTPATAAGEPVAVTAETRRAFQRWLKAARQPAEWGMRTLNGAWPRMTQPLPTDNAARQQLYNIVVRLHNLVATTVNYGKNEIRSVYYHIATRA